MSSRSDDPKRAERIVDRELRAALTAIADDPPTLSDLGIVVDGKREYPIERDGLGDRQPGE